MYLNYWLICTSSPVQARTHASLILRVLQHLGWVINFSKSDLLPSQQFNFIGMQFSMSTYTVTPLPKMGSKSRTHWKSHPRVTARDLHKILGILTFMSTLVPRGQLCLHAQSSDGHQRPGVRRQGPGQTGFSVTLTILHEAAWWSSPAVLQGVSLSALEAEITLFTDASSHRWGHSWAPISCNGHCPGSRQTSTSICWRWRQRYRV